MALFRRSDDDSEALEPPDDARDYHISDAQRRLRSGADTRRQMRKVWGEMLESLRHPWGNGKPLKYQ